MELPNHTKVLFVSKDSTYKKALSIILSLNFKAAVSFEDEIGPAFFKHYNGFQPDITIIDMDSVNEAEIELLKKFKKYNPRIRLVSLYANEEYDWKPDEHFDGVIDRNRPSPGFTSILKEIVAGKNLKNAHSIHPLNKVKQFNIFSKLNQLV